MKKVLKRGYRLIAIAVVVSLLLVLMPAGSVLAAGVDVTDTLSTYVKSTDANHEIGWTQTTAWTANQTIVVTFADDFTLTDVVYTDIDLYIGAEKTLVDTPATGSITCAVSGQTVTFTPFTDELLNASAVAVVIEIGTNAAGPGVNMITNPATAAEYTISVVSGADSGSVTVDITATGTTGASGDVVPTIEITTQPPAIDLGNMAIGTVYTSTESNNGLVKCNEAGWTVTATDQNTGAGTGSMRKDGTGTALTNAFQIYNVDTTWDASTGSVALVTSTAVTGSSGTAFTFNVKQLAITYDDVAGNYSITLVLTAALAGP